MEESDERRELAKKAKGRSAREGERVSKRVREFEKKRVIAS